MSSPAIRIDGISKRFIIGESIHGSGARTFRDIFDHKMKRLFGRAPRTGGHSNVIWALRGVTFDVQEGDVIGVIGRNGAGKSTLLKILSRITGPTEGSVTLHGRVASLLEVGTGFNLELTGRENIYLNGAILGMRKAEIDKKFDEIVSFAEVDLFIDTPVKRYSSGMFLRLAFSVAAHLEPEILIVDEVLAVGDVQFQRKCMGKMQDVSKNQGRTVLFVSHNMDAIAQLCTKCALLERGTLKKFGETQDVINAYLKPEGAQTGIFVNDHPPDAGSKLHLREVRTLDSHKLVTPRINSGDRIYVEIEYDVLAAVENARLGVMIKNHQGIILIRNGDADEDKSHYGLRSPGRYTNVCAIPTSILKSGDYFVSIFCDIPMREWLIYREDVLAFEFQEFESDDFVFDEYPTGVVKCSLAWEVRRNA